MSAEKIDKMFDPINSWNWLYPFFLSELLARLYGLQPHISHYRCEFHIETDNIFRFGFTIKHQYNATLKSIFEKFGSRSTDFVASIWRANHTWCLSQHVSYTDFWFGFRCKPYSCFTLMYFVNQICTNVCHHTPALLIIITSVYH